MSMLSDAASSRGSVPAMQQEVANRTRKLLEIELDDVLAVSAAKCCSVAGLHLQPAPSGRSLARLTTVPWLSLDIAAAEQLCNASCQNPAGRWRALVVWAVVATGHPFKGSDGCCYLAFLKVSMGSTSEATSEALLAEGAAGYASASAPGRAKHA